MCVLCSVIVAKRNVLCFSKYQRLNVPELLGAGSDDGLCCSPNALPL